jgi:hypothetical protein
MEGTWNGINLRVTAEHRTKIYVAGQIAVFCWKRWFGHKCWELLMEAMNTIKYNSLEMYVNNYCTSDYTEQEARYAAPPFCRTTILIRW